MGSTRVRRGEEADLLSYPPNLWTLVSLNRRRKRSLVYEFPDGKPKGNRRPCGTGTHQITPEGEKYSRRKKANPRAGGRLVKDTSPRNDLFTSKKGGKDETLGGILH